MTTGSKLSRSEKVTIVLGGIFIVIYIASFFVEIVGFIKFWPDVLTYFWFNFFLGIYWWSKSSKKVTYRIPEWLTLGQQTMSGTIKAIIIATSIFIPLSLTAIQIMVGDDPSIISSNLKITIGNLIIAIFWFGISTIFGLTTLLYINQKIGEKKNVLVDKYIGIPTNLQFYAMVMGVFRVLYSLYLLWEVMDIGLA